LAVCRECASKSKPVRTLSSHKSKFARLQLTSGNHSGGAYIGTEAAKSSSSYYVPLVTRKLPTASGVGNSEIVVQNPGGVAIQVSLQMLAAPGSGYGNYTKVVTIAGGGSYRYLLVNEASGHLPDGWYGSAVITAGSNKVAVISHFRQGSDMLQTFNATPQQDVTTQWYIPLFASRLSNGLNTPIGVQNISGQQLPVGGIPLSCVRDPGSSGPTTLTTNNPTPIANHGAYYFNPVTDTATFPTNWFGACRVTAAGNVASFVQMRYVGAGNLANAAAFEAMPGNGTAQTLIFPVIQKRLSNGSATAITIQNLSTTHTAAVTFAYYSTTGGTVSVVGPYTIPAGGSIIHNHRLPGTGSGNGQHNLPDNWQGSLVVTSSNRPINGFAQLTNIFDPPGDSLMAHNAIVR
jgi:hypothetical protein